MSTPVPTNLETVGYPRSGNTFLNNAIHLLYKTEYDKPPIHTSLYLDKPNIIVPMRNPLDCLTSWALFQVSREMTKDISHKTISADIRFYLRFHKKVAEKRESIILLDFDKFTKDVSSISKSISIEPKDPTVTVDKVIEHIKFWAGDWLPRAQDQNQIQEVRNLILSHSDFEDCKSLYGQIKSTIVDDATS